MEISVNIIAKHPFDDEYNDDSPLNRFGFLYFTGIVEFIFNVRIGDHIDTTRKITYTERGSSAFEAIQQAFERVMIRHGHSNDEIDPARFNNYGPRCPVHFSKLPVFLDIDHLPEYVQDMVKQIITGQHFKFLQS
jgi:hypothetical protein